LKNCPVTVTNAKVRFDGTPDLSASLLAIDPPSPVRQRCGDQPDDADKADLPLHGSNSYSYALSSTADNTLNFYAQYISTAAR
jgi:major type 1 subunit fimbrin (pilin)